MTEQILKIEIARPIEIVFQMIIDPNRSPEWIDSFKEETATPWPPRIGTVYRNSDHVGKWTEYTVDAFKPPRHFGIVRARKRYHVEYILSSPTPESTLVAYHEWVTWGKLGDPMGMVPFEKLKAILEAA